MATAEKKTESLAAKLAYITGQMRGVKKEGFNKAQQYAFVRETDVAEKLSALLAEKNVFLHQTVVAHTMHPLYITGSGSQMWLCEVDMEFRFMDGDSDEVMPTATFPGHGADTGDKGIYKAMTGAEKYMIMKTFLVSTGDDPEADEKVDKAAAAAGAAKGPVKITKGTQAGVQRGGRSDGATTAQVQEIAKLARDLNLDADGIVPVIAKILGSEPAEGVSVRDWLGGLTAQQAGDIITALAGMATFADMRVDKPVDTVENTDGDGPQEPFTVV